jgi:hypothetical protein
MDNHRSKTAKIRGFYLYSFDITEVTVAFPYKMSKVLSTRASPGKFNAELNRSN